MIVNKVGKLHASGPKGRKRWRVKFWVVGDPEARVKYFNLAQDAGVAAAKERLSVSPKNSRASRTVKEHEATRRDAERLLARWLQEVGADPGKAERVRLPMLQEHTNRYLDSIRPRYKKSSLTAIEHTIRYLHDHLKPNRRIDAITPEKADQFFAFLMKKKLADATLKHHLDNARAVFKSAMGTYPGHLRINPFAHIRIKPEPGQGTWKYVSYADAMKAIEACTDQYTSRIGWEVFIALQRFAGLRKGEATVLQKRDVDLTQDPMIIKVDGSKTARSTGERYRIVPVLYPILGDFLVRAIGESNPADPYVVSSQVARGCGAQRTTILRILKRAGLKPWKPTFQVLRGSCEYDFLKLHLPEAVYTQAIGHSPEVSRRYYLAKFQGAQLDEFTRDEFKAAADRLRDILTV